MQTTRVLRCMYAPMRPLLPLTASMTAARRCPQLLYIQRDFASSTIAAFHRLQIYQQQAQPPTPPSPPPQPQSESDDAEVRPTPALYRPFLRPFAKVFLTAMLTYQVLYWCWEKMRLDELKEEKLAEVKDLEAQVDAYRQQKNANAAGASHTYPAKR